MALPDMGNLVRGVVVEHLDNRPTDPIGCTADYLECALAQRDGTDKSYQCARHHVRKSEPGSRLFMENLAEAYSAVGAGYGGVTNVRFGDFLRFLCHGMPAEVARCADQPRSRIVARE